MRMLLSRHSAGVFVFYSPHALSPQRFSGCLAEVSVHMHTEKNRERPGGNLVFYMFGLVESEYGLFGCVVCYNDSNDFFYVKIVDPEFGERTPSSV